MNIQYTVYLTNAVKTFQHIELLALCPLGVDVYMLCGHKSISNKNCLIVLRHSAGSANGTA